MKIEVTMEKIERKTKTSKVDVNYRWTDTKRLSLVNHVLKIFYKYISLYCEQSALSGYKYLTEPRRMWIERIIWLAVHVTTMCVLMYYVIDAYSEFANMPMVTSVESDHYPTNKITFPAIAICSINRISRQSAIKMANEVHGSNVTSLSTKEILELFEQFGDAYDSMRILKENRRDELNRLLLDFYEGEYDLDAIMKELTPKCTLMLVKCLFNGKEYNCTDIFSFEKTQDGYCCTFNYFKEDISEEEEPMELFNVKDLGIEHGLTVVMEPFLDDYFYTFLPVIGWKVTPKRGLSVQVTLFNPTDYPDNISGGVTEVLVSPLLESYLEIEAVAFYSTDQTKLYPISKRKCIFPNEIHSRYGVYSYSDCLVNCREEQIWKLCKCIPFYLPTRKDVNDKHERRICTLTDVSCLNHYKSNCLKVIPHEDETFKNTIYENNSLHCVNCYPSCEDVLYTMQSSFTSMKRGIYETSFLNNIEIIDQSIINVFFSKYSTIRLKQDIAYVWYELLSDIGGICGVFIGFSLISVVEFIYFFLLLIYDLFKSYDRNSDEIEIEIDSTKEKESTTYTIYWNELVPQTRKKTRKSFSLDDYVERY